MNAFETFRANLRSIMDERDLTIQDLAELIGTSRPGLSRILSGAECVTLTRAERIANTLKVSLTDLLTAEKKSRQSA